MVDILPSETWQWQSVETFARHHFERAGINEIRTPLLETTELFNRGIGGSTDVVNKEMYSFVDRGDRSCTLRPEGTASVVRSLIQNGLISQGPQRLWYQGPMFRYERPQAGRQRQFHQLGVEFFGLSSIKSDAELISIAWDLLKQLGLKGITLQVNTLGTLEDRQKYRSQLVSWLEKYSKNFDEHTMNQLKNNPLRILDSKDKNIKKILEGGPMLIDYLCESSKRRFINLQEFLSELDIPFTINPKLVRGLDYYCHTAFEITSGELGSQSTVCGGGRYDGLVQQLGGSATSSIGWAIGMERLLILLANKIPNQNTPDIYLVNKGEKAELEALCLARSLRLANLKVELDNSGSAFSKQFKRASRSHASWALVIGEEEVNKGEVVLKSLIDKENFGSNISINISNIKEIVDIVTS